MVVDDEPFALDLILGYVSRTPFLELSGAFSNPFKALTALLNNSVDLVFLDINMPELSGIQLLKSLPTRPMVVFTTAYSEFGAESYEFDAIDYLLKPVKYERFLKAVSKAMEHSGHGILQQPEIPENLPVVDNPPFILIKSGTRVNKVRTDQILYIEGAGNYMTFHTREKNIMALLSMTEVLEMLPAGRFVRIHKSFVVNKDCIDVIEKHRVIINRQSIPIGVTYRSMDLKFK
jgi:two-component system LytT family response regulator